MSLQGKIVVITGASKGLGKALKEACEAHGAIVIGCASHRSPLCDAIVDVRDPVAVRRFIRSIINKHGTIDILINNAGWIGTKKPLESVTLAEYTRTIDTNLTGTFHTLCAVLPSMRKRNNGLIINIGSKAGTKPHPLLALYSASKAAILNLTQSLAKDFLDHGANIRCFSFSPGGIATDMRKKVFGKTDSQSQHSPAFIAELLMSCILSKKNVPSGADVQVTREGTLEIIPMA